MASDEAPGRQARAVIFGRNFEQAIHTWRYLRMPGANGTGGSPLVFRWTTGGTPGQGENSISISSSPHWLRVGLIVGVPVWSTAGRRGAERLPAGSAKLSNTTGPKHFSLGLSFLFSKVQEKMKASELAGLDWSRSCK
jgi:hypothetical protein